MKQKRGKLEHIELDTKLQNQASTRSGGNLDRVSTSTVKESNCAAGVCSVVWKPDSLKR